MTMTAQAIVVFKGTTLEYVHQDHLGGTAVSTNSTGTQVAALRYYSFGGARSSTGTLATDKKYTGQRLDGTGLYFYNARYYDAEIGRFVSADTLVPDLANPQDLNRYSYVVNNPLTYTDPSGHCLGRFTNAWGCGTLRNAGREVKEATVTVVNAYVEAVDTTNGAIVEGVQWTVGIEEVVPVTVEVGGKEVSYSNVVAQKSGLNLINNTLDVLNASAIALGGPIGVLSDVPLKGPAAIHEGQHVLEQQQSGTLEWHTDYQEEYWEGVALYGNMENSYKFHGAENRAREAAGQPTYDPSLDDLWFWPW